MLKGRHRFIDGLFTIILTIIHVTVLDGIDPPSQLLFFAIMHSTLVTLKTVTLY